jgi:hypothetical protein
MAAIPASSCFGSSSGGRVKSCGACMVAIEATICPIGPSPLSGSNMSNRKAANWGEGKAIFICWMSDATQSSWARWLISEPNYFPKRTL